MPCRLSSLVPAIVAGALVGAGIGWLISMAEWAITGDRTAFGVRGVGYIAVIILGGLTGAVLAWRAARTGGPSACKPGRPL
ncbi:MAG: hypothetical protein ACPHP1_06085 [Miltoncostaeaceae bacterium]